MNSIDVIVPVYRGLQETQECLDSVIRSAQSSAFEILVINDGSPEPELVEYLGQLADAGKITLLHNSHNLGFVETVNYGMSLHEDRDVVLLNSDTQVANDWLDRLAACAYRMNTTGTVTPFSNNATICSYPNFCEDNTIPPGLDVETLDLRFKHANQGRSIEIPTAVGFCMYIRRACLQEVGYFDDEAFGKGYGEENDFCMRAFHAGWQNRLCGDVFIYHAGNVSFGDKHNDRKFAAMEKLRHIHPDYEPLVHQHIAKNPANMLRQRVALATLLRHPRPLVMHITHNRGGGTERYIQELTAQLSTQIDAIILRPSADGSGKTELDYQGSLKLYFNIDQELEILTDLLRTLNLAQIHVHHTMGLHPAIFSLPEKLGIPWDFTLHDYYTVCPQLNLIDMKGRYCGEPVETTCDQCLKLRPAPGKVPIKVWRQHHQHLISQANRCFVPSKDAANRIQRYFPDANVIPHYHEENRLDQVSEVVPHRHNKERFKVLVIGALTPMKGAELLESVALRAKRHQFPIDFILLGYCYRDVIVAPQSNLEVTGAYDEAELLRLIAHHQPDLAWFPALWPETYSYTLSAALQAGLPIVAPNIGAFQERLYGRKNAWIVPWNTSPQELNDLFIELQNTLSSENFVNKSNRFSSHVLPMEDNFSNTKDYLLDHSKGKLSDSSVSLETFIERLENHLTPAFQISTAIRYKVLLGLLRLRMLPQLRWLARRIPQSLQGRAKNWLLNN